jgi:iron complex outermembrane receptor protein
MPQKFVLRKVTGAAVPLFLMATGVHAQVGGNPVESYGIQEVTVTAQKRSENLQQTPIAISALSGDDLEKRGIVNVSALVAQTPTLYIAPYASSNSVLTLYMRGQGNNDPMQITKDGSIGIYENGIYNARPQTLLFDLADIERVEVLRGPQGTLYGRNTTGGAVNILSKAPTGEFGLRQSISLGDRQQMRSVTNIDLPKIGTVSSKITFAAGHDDGYVENSGGSNNYNSKQYQGLRAALRWQPIDTLSVDYAYTWGDIDSTPGYISTPSLSGMEIIPGVPYRAPKYDTYRSVDLRESPTKISDHTLTVSWDVTSDLTLKSLTGVRSLDATMYMDYAEAFGFPFTVLDAVDSDQYSQEFQLIGSVGERIDYVAGLYYFDESASHQQAGTFTFVPGSPEPYDRNVDADAKSTAAYMQMTWTPPVMEDRLALTAGARFTRDERDATRNYLYNGFALDTNTVNDKDFSRFTPSLTAAYNFSETLNGYAKVATGYRAGGSSESASDFTQGFAPEKLTTYEAGLKAEWLDRRLRTNLAAFYSNYDDIQLDVSPDPDNISVTQTVNAGKATIQGIELDITAAPTDDLLLSVSYAWLDTEVKKVAVEGSPVTADDFVIPYAPENSLSLSGDYTFLRMERSTLTAHLDYSWKDLVYNTSGAGSNVPGREFYATDAYGTLNGRLTLDYTWAEDKEPVRVALWARNLLDKEEAVYTVGLGSSNTGYTASGYNYQEPLSVGVELSLAF